MNDTKKEIFEIKAILKDYNKLEEKLNEFVQFKNNLILSSSNPNCVIAINEKGKKINDIYLRDYPTFKNNLKKFLIAEHTRIENSLESKFLELKLFKD